MDNILGAKGLTSSEANHITNVTKELTKNLRVDLKLSTSFIKEANGEELPLDENEKNENWVQDVQKVGRLFSLSAWLKSAIKYKEGLLNTIERERFTAKTEKPEMETLPAQPDVDFEDYLNQLNTKQRNEFLTAEAIASHIGKFIHNFDAVRAESKAFVPTSFMRVGGEKPVTVRSERLYTEQELTDGFFELQKEHREAEKTVNLYKSRHHDWVKETLESYNSEVKTIQNRNRIKEVDYLNAIQAERLDFENSKKVEKKEISGMKIIIPKDLQPILDEVNEYAKK